MKPSNIDQNEYKLNCFSSFIGNVSDNSRGVVIYVRDGLNADYCSILTNSDFKESVWCEVRINKMEKLLIEGIYDVANHMALNELITQAVELKYKHTIILGDFYFPGINWGSWSVNRSETHPSFQFIECLRDNYLAEHVNSFTRYREGQDPGCLDLILTEDDVIIENLQFGDKLGASDHVSITFNISCETDRKIVSQQRPNFYKANYQAIRDYLRLVTWDDMSYMSSDESWNFFMSKINYCIEHFVPSNIMVTLKSL